MEDVDVGSDLATVRIPATGLPIMKLGQSSSIRPGLFILGYVRVRSKWIRLSKVAFRWVGFGLVVLGCVGLGWVELGRVG